MIQSRPAVPGVWLEAPRPGAVARARIRSLADILEVERTPFADLIPDWSVLALLERNAAAHPDKPAIIMVDRDDPTRATARLTYSELTAQVRATANRLYSTCDGARPVVTVLTPLVPEAFIASWAGATVGFCNPVNPFLRLDHVAEIMNAAGTTHLVCGARGSGPGAWDEVATLKASVPSLRAVWFVGEDGAANSFRRQIEMSAHDRLIFERSRDPDRTSALLHTGGTTAAPKLVRLTERGQLLGAWCCGAFDGTEPDQVIAVGMPYFHVGGATSLALAAIVFGQTIVIVGPDGYRSPRVISRFWDLVNAHGVTRVGSAPTTAAAIVAAHRCPPVPDRFTYWAGGATVPIQLAREFEDKFGIPLREIWGMTELQGGLALNPGGVPPRLGSIGLLFPYHRSRCVSIESRSAVSAGPNSVGILAISGPCVTPGYLDAARTRELFFDAESKAERWLNTGDLCSVDNDGYIWLRGRSKDLIIRGGHNIDPLTIEAALLRHSAVLYAAAIGAPDRDKGEIPVAYVQLRPGAAVREAELLEHCRCEMTERAAVPIAVRIMEAMPLTAVGKIFKPALRLDATRRCSRDAVSQIEGADAVEVEVGDGGGSITVTLRCTDPALARVVDRMRRELERFTFRVQIDGKLDQRS
jgi:fatty-acyl-CoA synthase